MKIAIVTGNVGLTQPIENPSVIHKDVDYYAFVDVINKDLIWNQIKIHEFSHDTKWKNRRNVRIYKILTPLFLPGYDYYIWIDKTHDVYEKPAKLIELIGDNDIGCFRHPTRDCVYQEIAILKKYFLDTIDNLNRSEKFLRSENFEENFGLIETPGMVFKNSDKVTAARLCWWDIICKYSSRDQVSLPYVLKTFDIKYHLFKDKDNYINAQKALTSRRSNPVPGLHFNSIIPKVRMK